MSFLLFRFFLRRERPPKKFFCRGVARFPLRCVLAPAIRGFPGRDWTAWHAILCWRVRRWRIGGGRRGFHRRRVHISFRLYRRFGAVLGWCGVGPGRLRREWRRGER